MFIFDIILATAETVVGFFSLESIATVDKSYRPFLMAIQLNKYIYIIEIPIEINCKMF